MKVAKRPPISNAFVVTVLDDVPGPVEELPPLPPSSALFVPSLDPDQRTALATHVDGVLTAEDLVTPEIASEAKRAASDAIDRVWRLRVDGGRLGDRFVYNGVRLADVAHSHLAHALVESLVKVSSLDAWW